MNKSMSYNTKLHQWKIDCILKINEYNAKVHQKQAVIVAAVVATANTSTMIKKKYKKKRYWMAEIYKQRRQIGFYYLIFPMLKLDDLRFKNYCRMNFTQFEELLELIAPKISRQYVIREPIEAEQRLIICLRYLASGDSMVSMSHQYSVSQTIISQIIHETCQAIWDVLYPLVLPMHTHKEWKEIATEMDNKWQFPHCIGAMDGKHVVIQSPQHSGSAYYNYKKTHSIVLLAICDANYVFTYVDIGAFGRQSDGGIFKNSIIGQKFAQGQMDVPPAEEIFEGSAKYPYVLVADEAFPLSPYLMRPFSGRDSLSTEKKIFNYRLSRARRTIENAFGILAAQWRIYRKPIIAKVTTVENIVKATVTLHNWLRKKDMSNTTSSMTAGMVDGEVNDRSIMESNWRNNVQLDNSALQPMVSCSTHTHTQTSAEIRQQFMNYFNEEGAIPWQFVHIFK